MEEFNDLFVCSMVYNLAKTSEIKKNMIKFCGSKWDLGQILSLHEKETDQDLKENMIKFCESKLGSWWGEKYGKIKVLERHKESTLVGESGNVNSIKLEDIRRIALKHNRENIPHCFVKSRDWIYSNYAKVRWSVVFEDGNYQILASSEGYLPDRVHTEDQHVIWNYAKEVSKHLKIGKGVFLSKPRSCYVRHAMAGWELNVDGKPAELTIELSV